ncbi:MAG: 30S ribosome-binding factor RbfA [Chloroflexi bacterium]|nr:30S ribosome-binding factor RbfA [Chloroflexota bacterium]
MSRTFRKERLEELLRRELGSILSFGLKDPRLTNITLNEIEVSLDLQTARIFVSVLEEDDDVEQVKQALEHARGFLRSSLAGRLTLRHVPDLVFRVSRSVIEAQRIDALFAQLPPSSSEEPDILGEDID